MEHDRDTYYQALLSRDRRFDGWFFVGVSSTGIYCRPVCAVRTPKLANCSFYGSAAAAEKQGFRPCLRCRPELAPGHGVLDISGKLARTAAALIEAGFLNQADVPALAARIGVTERHLRRIFAAEFGVTVIEYLQTQRLLLAKRLLSDTALPVVEVAFAAGFASVRRFNDVFQAHYRLSPRQLRKAAATREAPPWLSFELAYRPPFAWEALLDFLARRAIAGVEWVADGAYHRTVALEIAGRSVHGWIKVEHRPARHAVLLSLPPVLAPAIALLLDRVRHIFDLACRPDLVDAHLGELAAGLPGLRVPGAFDGFEMAVRAIIGQQISVAGARTILGRIAAQLGGAYAVSDAVSDATAKAAPDAAAPPGLHAIFPSAQQIAALPVERLYEVGIIRTRAAAIHAIACEIAAGRLALEPLVPLEPTLAALRAIKGVGDWTAQYIAMRALCWPNALPAGDYVLKKQLGLPNARAVEQHAQAWAPWRAYATLHVWRKSSET
jgi:AraC family transcriptional regulator of adaptative response / DNA-3-methyladenine glycosylase II